MSGKVELELINDGTLNVADLLYENLYGVTNDSLENINGQLTSENLTENIAIKYQNVQRVATRKWLVSWGQYSQRR